VTALSLRLKRALKSELAHNWRRNASAIAGTLIIAMFAFMVAFGPWLVAQDPYDVRQLDLMDAFKPPVWLEGGSAQYWLGTDQQGRDVLASIVYGSRISLFIGLAAMLASCLIGTTLGMMIADVPAVFIGDRFAARIPMKLVHGIAAAMFAVMGLATLFGAGAGFGF
jgi:peptide/nickel transport system permease protein